LALVQKKTGDTMKFEVESRLDDLFGDEDSFGETEQTDTVDNFGFHEDESNSFAESPHPPFEKSETEHFNESHSDDVLEPAIFEVHEEGGAMSEDHPLEELKSTVLSIDWEITDEVMTRFVNQVEDLKRTFKNDKINMLFCQLLGSVGTYIKINRGKADPDAFKVLGSAFKAFDDVVSSNTMPNQEKKKRLSVELDKFKDLKQKIANKKTVAKPSTPSKAAPRPETPIQQKKTKPVFGDDHIEVFAESSTRPPEKIEDDQEIILRPVGESNPVNTQEIISEVLTEMKKFIRGEFDDLREELRLRKKRR